MLFFAQVKKLRDRQDEDERFTALMDRHRQRMLMLEKEKRVILAMPAGDLDDWELKRIRAAAKVQAHWRGYKARQQYAQLPDRVQREQVSMTTHCFVPMPRLCADLHAYADYAC